MKPQYDRLPWQGHSAPVGETQTYEAFIPEPLEQLEFQLSTETLSLCDDAGRALTRFDQKYSDQSKTLGSLLSVTEALASSRIENIHETAQGLGEALAGRTSRPNANSVAANLNANTGAFDSQGFSNEKVLAAHRTLMQDVDPAAGTYRSEQVWIGSSSHSPLGALFVPPVHHRIPQLMEDLTAYANRIDIPPLHQAAIAHAQFETIHPFTDGNGRTGRSMIHSMLKHHEVMLNVMAPISVGLLFNTRNYYDALNDFRAGNPETIMMVIAHATFRAVAHGELLAKKLGQTTQSWNGLDARKDSAAWKILPLLAGNPVLSAEKLSLALDLDYPRLKRAMDSLERAGIVTAHGKYKHRRYWVAPQVVNAVNESMKDSLRRFR